MLPGGDLFFVSALYCINEYNKEVIATSLIGCLSVVLNEEPRFPTILNRGVIKVRNRIFVISSENGEVVGVIVDHVRGVAPLAGFEIVDPDELWVSSWGIYPQPSNFSRTEVELNLRRSPTSSEVTNPDSKGEWSRVLDSNPPNVNGSSQLHSQCIHLALQYTVIFQGIYVVCIVHPAGWVTTSKWIPPFISFPDIVCHWYASSLKIF